MLHASRVAVIIMTEFITSVIYVYQVHFTFSMQTHVSAGIMTNQVTDLLLSSYSFAFVTSVNNKASTHGIQSVKICCKCSFGGDEHPASKMRADPARGLESTSAWAGPCLGSPQLTKEVCQHFIHHKCNCVKVTNALFLLSYNCQRRSVVLIDNPTVESENRYSLTELAQHQQHTAVMTMPYVSSFLRRGLSWIGPHCGWFWARSGQAELWLGPGRPMHISRNLTILE